MRPGQLDALQNSWIVNSIDCCSHALYICARRPQGLALLRRRVFALHAANAMRRPAAELAIAERMTDLHPTLRATDSAPSDPRPLALLQRLASARLPVMVAEDAEIEVVRVLQLSGSLKASVPEPRRTLHGHLQAPATVTEVTRLGLQLLGSFVRCRSSWRLRATPHAPLYRRAAGCGQIGE